MRLKILLSAGVLPLAVLGSESGLVGLAAVDPIARSSIESHCESMMEVRVAETELTAAGPIAARENLPGFCQLEGRIAGRVGFVMRLPVTNWNGKFAVTGCGGFCGSLIPDKPGHSNSMNEALKLGYAVIQTDGGHEAQSWETDWALDDDTALDLYAGAWMPLAVATGRGFVQSYYASAPRRTYFTGCSNGGRLGLFAAQRYPALFDGIAAGGGIFDLSGNAGIHGLWLLQSTRDKKGNAVIDASKIPLLQQHVMAGCDSLDGVADEVISRPGLCEPQIDSLQCTQQNGPDCFTVQELAAIKRLYQGAKVDGKQLYPGLAPGSETLWSHWVAGTDEKRQWGELAAEGNLRMTYRIPASRPFNPYDYELAAELEQLQRLAPRLNATDPDLSAFAGAGGKLFYYHGLADPLILPGRAMLYYEEVVATLGKKKLDEFARFIMVPGHGHCWEKPGQVADDFNPLEIIDHWVESGIAPPYVTATQKSADGTILRSRKLCPMPQAAEFQGGDQTKASNFQCVNSLSEQ
jgi:feruloyl esterase